MDISIMNLLNSPVFQQLITLFIAPLAVNSISDRLKAFKAAIKDKTHEEQLLDCLEKAFFETERACHWKHDTEAIYETFMGSLMSFSGSFNQDSLAKIFRDAVGADVTDRQIALWVDNVKKQISLEEHTKLREYLLVCHIMQDQTPQSESKPKYILTSSASIYDNPEIICREEFIEDLLGLLSSGHKRIQIAGMGGLGKTEVLKKVYAKLTEAKEKSEFDHIAYIQFNGEISDDIEAQIDYPNQYKGLEGINASNLFIHDICSDKNVLLCIDDIRTTAELIKAEHPCIRYLNSLGAKVLLASRVIFPTFEEAPLELLSTDSCIAIFEKGYGRAVTKQDELDVLKAIIETRAGNHTLVVSRLSSMASEYEWSVLDLSKKLSEQNFNIATDISDDTEFQNEINKLYLVDEKLTESEKTILTAFSIFPAIPLTYDVCVDWLHEDAKLDSDLCALALNKLSKKTWLIKQNGSNVATPFYSMHSIVNAAVQSQLRKEKPLLPHMIDHITSTLSNLVVSYDYSKASGVVPFAISIVPAVVFESNAYFILCSVIAFYYFKTANYNTAEEWYRMTLAVLSRLLGLNHPYVAMTQNNLAAVLDVKGNLSEALSLYHEALSVLQTRPENEAYEISIIMSNIGVILLKLGSIDMAFDWFNKGLSIDLQKGEAKKLSVSEAYRNIANVYLKKGDLLTCRENCETALVLLEEMNMLDNPVAARLYAIFATLCQSENKVDDSLVWLLKSLEIRERVLGVDHPDTAETYNNISAIYERKDEIDKALIWVQKAQKVCEKVYGRMHTYTATTYNNIGRFHRKLGEYQLALDWHQNAIEIYEQVAGNDYPNIGVLYSNLADVYFDLKHYELAQSWYKKAQTALKNCAYPNEQNVKYVEDRLTEVAMNIEKM